MTPESKTRPLVCHQQALFSGDQLFVLAVDTPVHVPGMEKREGMWTVLLPSLA